MRIVFVRHGEPDYEHDSLTEKGFREADLLAPRVAKWDVKQFYCSPLGRAQRTCEHAMQLITPPRDVIIYDWLREFPIPVKDTEKDGMRLAWDFLPDKWADDELMTDKDDWWKSPLMQNPELKPYYDKVVKGLDELIESYGYKRNGHYYDVVKHSDDTIVIFCHFGIISFMMSHLINVSPVNLLHGFCMQPTSVTVLNTEERDGEHAFFRCHMYGDTQHLHDGGEPISHYAYFAEIFQG